jgi:hypothetical protein
MLKSLLIIKRACIFAPTVPVLHTIRTAFGSFFCSLSTKDNTPLMPLFDAHLRGFFFLMLIINEESL